MSTDLDHLVREMVIELATEGHPVNLAEPAMRSARLLRTRRRIAAVISVFVLIAGLAAVAAAGTGPPVPPPVVAESSASESSPPPSGSPSAAPSGPSHGPDGKQNRPVLLPGGWAVRGAPTVDGVAVFDDRTGTYREVAVPGGVASPDGRYVVSFAGGTTVRIQDVQSGRDIANSLPGTANAAPAWSGDGTRFAYVDGSARIVIVTLATGAGRGSWQLACGSCDLRWSNADQEIRVYLYGSVHVVDPATGAVSTGVGPRQDDTDPCPGHRGYQVAATALTPDERTDLAGSQDVWGCVVQAGFQLRSAAGDPSTTTDLSGATRHPGQVADPARFTLFTWTG